MMSFRNCWTLLEYKWESDDGRTLQGHFSFSVDLSPTEGWNKVRWIKKKQKNTFPSKNLIILACRGFCSLNLLLWCQLEFVMLWFIFNNICKWAFGFINKTFAQNALFNFQWRSWSLTFDAIAEVSSSCLIWQWNAPFLCKSMKNGGNILAFWQKVQNIFFCQM